MCIWINRLCKLVSLFHDNKLTGNYLDLNCAGIPIDNCARHLKYYSKEFGTAGGGKFCKWMISTCRRITTDLQIASNCWASTFSWDDYLVYQFAFRFIICQPETGDNFPLYHKLGTYEITASSPFRQSQVQWFMGDGKSGYAFAVCYWLRLMTDHLEAWFGR